MRNALVAAGAATRLGAEFLFETMPPPLLVLWAQRAVWSTPVDLERTKRRLKDAAAAEPGLQRRIAVDEILGALTSGLQWDTAPEKGYTFDRDPLAAMARFRELSAAKEPDKEALAGLAIPILVEIAHRHLTHPELGYVLTPKQQLAATLHWFSRGLSNPRGNFEYSLQGYKAFTVNGLYHAVHVATLKERRKSYWQRAHAAATAWAKEHGKPQRQSIRIYAASAITDEEQRSLARAIADTLPDMWLNKLIDWRAKGEDVPFDCGSFMKTLGLVIGAIAGGVVAVVAAIPSGGATIGAYVAAAAAIGAAVASSAAATEGLIEAEIDHQNAFAAGNADAASGEDVYRGVSAGVEAIRAVT